MSETYPTMMLSREEMIKQSREEAVKLYKRAYELQQLPATLSPPQSVINATNFLMKALCIAGKPKSASGMLASSSSSDSRTLKDVPAAAPSA